MAATNYGNVSVGTTAVAIATSFEGTIIVANNGTNPIFLGLDANVTTSNGIPVAGGGNIALSVNTISPGVYGISTATQDVRFMLLGL